MPFGNHRRTKPVSTILPKKSNLPTPPGFKIFSGFLPANNSSTKTGYIYCQKIGQPSPTVIWMLGGGFSTTTLAFSGTGPWIANIPDNKVVVNPYILDYSQVFLDVGGQGFSRVTTFPKNDEEYVEYWYDAIQSFRSQFHLNSTESVLAGVSYGTKTAFQLLQKYRSELKVSSYVAIALAITQYYNYLTMPNTLQYKGLVQYSVEESKTLNKILAEFSFYYKHQKYDEMIKYIDTNGIILQYLEGIMNQPDLNVWNLALFKAGYNSNKTTVYDIVTNIDIQKKLDIYDPTIFEKVKEESGTFTVDSWNNLCCTPSYSSYVVPIDNEEFFNPKDPIPKIIIQGDNDCITNPNYIPLMIREFLNQGIDVSELRIDFPVLPIANLDSFRTVPLLDNVAGNQYSTDTGIQVKRVFNSGHLVSYDQPFIASKLISDFLGEIYPKPE